MTERILLVSLILLWIVVLVQGIGLFALYHHFGQMYLNSREGRATQGPEVGSSLKAKNLPVDVAGNAGRLPIPNRPTLILFTSTTCKVCEKLREVLLTWVPGRSDVEVLLLCGGGRRAVAEWARNLVEDVRVVPDPSYGVAAHFGVGLTPFALAIDASGIVRSKMIVNDVHGLEALADAISMDLSENGMPARRNVEGSSVL